jgi:hypothetical protein
VSEVFAYYKSAFYELITAVKPFAYPGGILVSMRVILPNWLMTMSPPVSSTRLTPVT